MHVRINNPLCRFQIHNYLRISRAIFQGNSNTEQLPGNLTSFQIRLNQTQHIRKLNPIIALLLSH